MYCYKYLCAYQLVVLARTIRFTIVVYFLIILVCGRLAYFYMLMRSLCLFWTIVVYLLHIECASDNHYICMFLYANEVTLLDLLFFLFSLLSFFFLLFSFFFVLFSQAFFEHMPRYCGEFFGTSGVLRQVCVDIRGPRGHYYQPHGCNYGTQMKSMYCYKFTYVTMITLTPDIKIIIVVDLLLL